MLDTQEILKTLNRPVAVFGSGVSGRSVGRLLNHLGVSAEYFDQLGSMGASRSFEDFHATRHELVIYSPGFSQGHPWLQKARQHGLICLGEMDFASIFWKGRIVAITGTNGKTSLTKFLTEALRLNGQDAFAVGNIGMPLSQLIPDLNSDKAIALCEVSSFQSESMNHFVPDTLLWTNMSADHLDRHDSMEGYFKAKYRLVERLCSPRLIVGSSVSETSEKLGYSLPNHTIILDEKDSSNLGNIEDTLFSKWPQRENYNLARNFWEISGFNTNVLEQAARRFSLPRHRLQRVAEWNGISFWNDSKATNFGATLAALKRFGHKVHWIGGGHSKGGEIGPFAKEILPYLEGAYLIGETSTPLQNLLSDSGTFVESYAGLQNALLAAYMRADSPSVILFSPGFSSFDQFSNYEDRGNKFINAVTELRQQNSLLSA